MQWVGKNSILQLRAWIMKLTDKRLIGKLGILRTEVRFILGMHVTKFVLEIVVKNRS